LKVVTEEAVRMSEGKLFHAVGPAMQNARLRRRRLVRGTTRSPRATEQRAARVETVVTGTKDCKVTGICILDVLLATQIVNTWRSCVVLCQTFSLKCCS